MGTVATMTMAEYLVAEFEGDREFVHGLVLERQWGDFPHACVFGELLGQLDIEGFAVLPSCRMHIAHDHVRVPDVMVLRAEQKVHRIVTEPPLICIEVLSPEDTMSRMQHKVREYVAFGVENIWLFDPETRLAYRCDAKGFYQVQEDALTVPGTPIRIVLAEVFSALD